MAVHVPLSLVPGEEGADWMVGEQVADDPAITFGADDLGGAQVAQSLGDLFLIDDPAAGPVGGQKVHDRSLPDDQFNS